MKARTKNLISLVLLSSAIVAVSGCDQKKNVDKDNLVFDKEHVVLNDFEGLGVEWGTYEDPDKLSSDSWERSLKIMDRLNPQVTRCMQL